MFDVDICMYMEMMRTERFNSGNQLFAMRLSSRKNGKIKLKADERHNFNSTSEPVTNTRTFPLIGERDFRREELQCHQQTMYLGTANTSVENAVRQRP